MLLLPAPQVKPPAFDQHRCLQLLNERCEVMSLLTHLYVGADALTHHAPDDEQLSQMTLSPDIYAAQTILAQLSARQDPDEADQAEAQELTGPLKELASMCWPSCSEQQFLQLLELLGSAVYAASAGAAAATVPSGQLLLTYVGAAGRAATDAAGSGASNGSRSQAVELQQLSEALVSAWGALQAEAHAIAISLLFTLATTSREQSCVCASHDLERLQRLLQIKLGAAAQTKHTQRPLMCACFAAVAGHIPCAGRAAPCAAVDGHGEPRTPADQPPQPAA